MGGLLSCLCAGGQPPYDRLTSIYAAAVDLSGSTSFPDSLCVAGKPPLARLGYIYAVFRDLAADSSLPSQECVEGEAPSDQVSRIYQAARIYSGDSSLADVACVRGRPIWQQFLEVYRALYLASGSPADLTNPNCVSPQPSLDVLTHIYCALGYLIENANPVVLSAVIQEDGNNVLITFSQAVTGTSGFSFTVDGVDRSFSYQSGDGTNVYELLLDDAPIVEGEVVLLDYSPGSVVSVATGNPLEAFVDFPVTNPFDVFTYLRPGGVFTYHRPDGTSIYIRP